MWHANYFGYYTHVVFVKFCHQMLFICKWFFVSDNNDNIVKKQKKTEVNSV